MLIIKLIKKLKSITAKLKAHAMKAQECKLETCAERFDMAGELCEKRIETAERIALALLVRAESKRSSDEKNANDARAKAAKAIDELNLL